jgi:hypothetical protein
MSQQEQSSTQSSESIKIRDLEEKQRVLKDRVLLIGQNLVDLKEKNQKEFIGIKKDIEDIKQGMDRIKSFMESSSEEFSKFAKKEDLEILSKQAKMFQPLDFGDKSKS